jgi:multiple sugar transport system ATP-binding protein
VVAGAKRKSKKVSFLQLSQLRKTYADGTAAVKGIDLSIEEGEFIVLLGPSGCGKTTTLRMIAGLEIATGGTITLGGEDVTKLRPAHRDVGFVFQFYALYPHLCVRDNIAFPLVSVGMPSIEVHRRVDAVAMHLGLTQLLRAYPRQLSGGDQQRVSLARAMVRRPRVWLMDEPLGTLDADQRETMRDLLRQQQLESRVTTIYVTHDQEEAMSLADRIVVMRDGEILQAGPPEEIYNRPADLFVANFVGSPGMNFIAGTISGSDFQTEDGSSIDLSKEFPAGKATLGVRCEHVRIDPAGSLGGTIEVDEYLGTFRLVYVRTAMGRVIVREGTNVRRTPGENVKLSFDPKHVCLFDQKGKGYHGLSAREEARTPRAGSP